MIDLQQPATDIAAIIQANVPSVRLATDAPPNKISLFPFVEVYLFAIHNASYLRPNNMVTCPCTYHADLHVAIKDAPREAKALHILVAQIVNALGKAVKGGAYPSLNAIGEIPVQLSFFAGGAGQGTDTVGYRFSVEVKVQGTLI